MVGLLNDENNWRLGWRPTIPKPLSPMNPEAAAQLAVDVARLGIGRVSPNPLVGAVLVDGQHRFLGAGHHAELGGSHAEVAAWESVQANGMQEHMRGSTMYVTLEPCSHHGRTPPCAEMLAKLSGLKRVIYGCEDPNPRVNGQGISILRNAGIGVEQMPALKRATEKLCEVFLWNQKEKKPFVALKAAVSLNGSIGLQGDERQWLTGEVARSYGHRLRVYYDAVAVGAETVITDNPALTPYALAQSARAPWRLVFDPNGRALAYRELEACQMLQHSPATVIWCVNSSTAKEQLERIRALSGAGASVWEFPANHAGRFNLHILLAHALTNGIHSVLLEGGAGLYRSFLEADLVQKLHLFQSPVLLGVPEQIPWSMSALTSPRQVLSDPEITSLGDDWVVEGYL